VLRFEVSIDGAAPLPPVDLDVEVIEIGSAPDVAIRLPAAGVASHHVRIERTGATRLIALEPVSVDDVAVARGAIIDLAVPARIRIGPVAIAITAAGGAASQPIRTASLAREVIRAMVASAGGAPELVVEAGPGAGARCALDPPPSRLVVGRGEDADWIVVDPDLSRGHLAVERSWDAVTVIDLGSKNGTRVGGVLVPATGAPLAHDAVIEAGGTRIRFTDPAAKYLAELVSASGPTPPRAVVAPAPGSSSPPVAVAAATALATRASGPAGDPVRFWVAIAIAALALGGLVWVLL